jgi:phage terminase large subunit-like protein
VREVAKILTLPSLMSDFGALFPMSMKKEDMAKSSMGSFESTNGVKIEAKSLGSTIRGSNTITQEGDSTRPTLLILDDIDVEKSVQNSDIIEANERKILGETIGALDPVRRRIIFLGNIINQDGVVPRFRDRFLGSWDIYEQWLYNDSGDCVWPDQFTEEVIANLKRDGERSFAQNYLGIPFSGGDTIIKRTSIKYADAMPSGARLVIGIDPAFSEKTGTDGMGFCLTGHLGVNKYVHTMVGLTGNEKDEERFCSYTESMYRKFGVSVCNVEANNGGEIIARMLKRRNLAVSVKKATRDKVTRLREYEGCFDRGEVFFLPGTEQGVQQLLSFPH